MAPSAISLTGHLMEQQSILDYDFVVEELSRPHLLPNIKDIFTRANKYTVSLSPQELRHAKAEGKFASVCRGDRGLAVLARQIANLHTGASGANAVMPEFAAELAILLAEGSARQESPRLTFGTSPIERCSSLLSNFVIGSVPSTIGS